MQTVQKDNLLLLEQLFDTVTTLKDVLLSPDCSYGKGYKFPLAPDLDHFLSRHVIAYYQKDVWDDNRYKSFVRNKPLLTLTAFMNLYYPRGRNCHSVQLTRNYYLQFASQFEVFFNLLGPSRRSLFCFVFSCCLFVHLGSGNFLQVGGRLFPDEKVIYYLLKDGKIAFSPTNQNDPKLSELLVPFKPIKKCKFSHKWPKGFSNIPVNKLLYQPSSRRMHLFARKFDSTECILSEIFGQIPLQNGLIFEYRDLFESIKINHMTCYFIKVLNQITGKSRPSNRATLESLVQMYTPHDKVCEFMRRIFFYVFPRQLFGSNQNRQRFYRGLKLIITTPRISKIRYSNVSRGLNFKTIVWLDSTKKHPSQGYFLKFTHFVISYILDLLRSFFYVTETQFARNEHVFYRKSVWNRIHSLSVQKMAKKQGRFIQVRSSTKDRKRMFKTKFDRRKKIMLEQNRQRKAYPVCRIIPKKSSVRIICPNDSFAANEEECSAVKAIIRSMRRVKTSRGRFEDFTRFVYWCKTMHAHQQKLYMIRGDILDCYPSIDQDLLMSIIRKHMEEMYGSPQPNFVNVLITDIVNITRKKHFTTEMYITPYEPVDCLLQQLKELLPDLTDCFIIPRKVVKVTDPEKIIRDQVKTNVVNVGSKKYIELSHGIRQGDPLSCDLAALYMEHYISDIVYDLCKRTSDGPRFASAYSADDMIFASIDKEIALDILSRITRPFVKYNLQANFSKLQINFSQSVCPEIKVSNYLTFGGFKIDSFEFSAFADFSAFSGSHIKYTFDSNQFKPLKEVRTHLIQQVSMIRTFLLDPYINCTNAIAKNLYEKVYLQGLRFAYFLLASPVYRVRQVPCQVLSFTVSIIRRIIRRKQLLPQKELPFSDLHVAYITTSALCHLWNLHESLYSRKKERLFFQRYLLKLTSTLGPLPEFSNLGPSSELASIKLTS